MNRRYNPDLHHRRSIRLRGYDYTRGRAYYATLVTHERRTLFGEVVEERMRLNEAGKMAQAVWEALPHRFPSIELDAFVIMPNHTHGILIMDGPVGAPLVGALDRERATDGARATIRVAPTILGNAVGAYKSLTTVEYIRGVERHEWQPFTGRLWQRNYYERVIRDSHELDRAREYIANNPLQWELDRENPDSGGSRAAPTGDAP